MVGIGAEPKLLGSFDVVWKYLGQLDESAPAPSPSTVDDNHGTESDGTRPFVLTTRVSFGYPSFRIVICRHL